MRKIDHSFLEKIKKGVASLPFCSHAETLRSIPELDDLILDDSFPLPCYRTKDFIRVAVFNMERGYGLDKILIYLKHHPALIDTDILLANELDWGMERTHKLNIAHEIASAVGYQYAYGIEFATAEQGQTNNAEGLHGNTVFSRFPILRAKMIRLPIVYEWLHSDQPRIGTRNAIAVIVEIDGREIGFVSAHLENRTTPSGRLVQMKSLLEGMDSFFGDLPVIVGGDMNTNCVDGNDDDEVRALAFDDVEQQRRLEFADQIEPLFALAVQKGYDYHSCNLISKSTRRKPIQGKKDLLLNLDWLFSRGITGKNPLVVRSIFDAEIFSAIGDFHAFHGQQFSDHDIVLADFPIKESI